MQHAAQACVKDRGNHHDIAKAAWQALRIFAFLQCLPACGSPLEEYSPIDLVR